MPSGAQQASDWAAEKHSERIRYFPWQLRRIEEPPPTGHCSDLSAAQRQFTFIRLLGALRNVPEYQVCDHRHGARRMV